MACAHCLPVSSVTPSRPIEFQPELVQTHQQGVQRYLRFLGCSKQAADELSNETFTALWQQPPEDRGPAALAAWLRRTALNLMRMQKRAMRSGIELADAEELEAVWIRNAGDDDGSHYVDALRMCVHELPERQRRAVELRYATDATRTEIATKLGVSEEGVKTALRRAKDSLGICVRRRLGESS